MFFKLLSDLNCRELRAVFRGLGKRGVFLESQAVVQITIYLVNIGMDPFTYRFSISEPEVEVSKCEVNEAKDVFVSVPQSIETASGAADGVSVNSETLPTSECSSFSSAVLVVSSPAYDSSSIRIWRNL